MNALPEFDSAYTRALPADPETENLRRQVEAACYSRVQPTAVRAPTLLAVNRGLASELGFSADFLASRDFLDTMAGNRTLPGMDPYAMCYGGHQFGNWAGQLGDGRAINLGERRDVHGTSQTLQLKGAGPTPYSRTADGRAVLRSSVREYLCSEAMHALGVPTTRALSLVGTGEEVVRDMFYSGDERPEPGAVVCRVAPGFVRFGNFEIHAARGETETLRQLADYVLETWFADCGTPGPDGYVGMFEEVARRTADMIVHWMRVGFVHGVMNTDNLSVLGQTIDYGPYGWLDDFDPDWTPNTTDAQGRRYRYGQQPQIGMWNLTQLGNALYPLVGEVEPLQAVLSMYADRFQAGWQHMMAAKLGLPNLEPETDVPLFNELLTVLTRAETDMTIFYGQLGELDIAALTEPARYEQAFEAAWYSTEPLDADYRAQLGAWMNAYARRLAAADGQDGDRGERMRGANPRYVLRNYMAQLAIDAAEAGDLSVLGELQTLLERPYERQADRDQWYARRPDWARNRAGCSMLSCSS